MANIIEMPKLSDTMTVGTLVKWLKKEGDAVKTGDILAEVETDKATMELESFFDGTLLAIFVKAGSQVPLGAPLCAIGKAGEKVDAPAGQGARGRGPGLRRQAPAQPSAARGGSREPQAGRRAPRPRPRSTAPPPAPARLAVPAARSPADGSRFPPWRASSPRRRASIPRESPAAVPAAGSSARTSSPRRRAAARSAPAAASSAGSGARLAKAPVQEEKLVPVSNIRATIARRLLESKTQIPHFYLDIEVDAGPLLELRAQLNAALEKDGVKLSVNDFILKASAEALRRVPGGELLLGRDGHPPSPGGPRLIRGRDRGRPDHPGDPRRAPEDDLRHQHRGKGPRQARQGEEARPGGIHGRNLLRLESRDDGHRPVLRDHQPAQRRHPGRGRHGAGSRWSRGTRSSSASG